MSVIASQMPATQVFVEQLVQANIEENIKAKHYSSHKGQ